MAMEPGCWAIVGGTVVTESFASPLTVVVNGDGRIAGLLSPEVAPACDSVLDATGLVVVPGGVDAHSHFNDPGRVESEDFFTGTAGAAAGGFTTVLEMPLTIPLVANAEILAAKRGAVAERAVVDYGLWAALTPENADDVAAIQDIAAAGAIGLKAFLSRSVHTPSVDGGELLRGARTAASLGLPVGVHCEEQLLIDVSKADLMRQGRQDLRAISLSRPPEAETEAVRRVLSFVQRERVAIHVVHLSLPESFASIADARAHGVDVTGETCPHYLSLTEDDVERSGVWAVCEPPLRTSEAREDLWRLLGLGLVDTVGSDHAPYTKEEKEREDVWEVPGGINGVQVTLPLLLDGAMRRGIPLCAIVRAFSSRPARRFGLYPRKGSVLPGSDADLVLVAPNEPWTVHAEELFSRTPAVPYEGMQFRAKVKRTIVRGRIVYSDDGQPPIESSRGHGLFLEPCRMARAVT